MVVWWYLSVITTLYTYAILPAFHVHKMHRDRAISVNSHIECHVASQGDTGPNTGGMGAYSGPNGTLPFLVQADVDAAQTINEKIAEALREQENYGYKGT